MNLGHLGSYGLTLLGLAMLAGHGCNTSDPLRDEADQLARQERRSRYFQNSAGKEEPQAEAVSAELLHSTSDPLLHREIPENPYPIYEASLPDRADRASGRKQEELPFPFSEADPKIDAALDFNEAALPEVIGVFAGLLKFNYQLDGKLSGTVNLSLNSELSKRELWQTFKQILRAANVYLAVENRIVHFDMTERIAQSPVLDAPAADVGLEIFTLKNTAAKDIAAQVAQFLSPGVKPVELEGHNSLLIADTRHNLEKIRQIIARLDLPLRQGWAKMAIPCRNISAARLAQEAAEVLPILGFSISLNSEKPRAEEIQLIALERLQIIVASAANQEALTELGRWISILDQADVGDQERIFVYNILNGKAEELVKALSVMFPVEGETMLAGSRGSGETGGGSDGSLNSSSSSASSTSSIRSGRPSSGEKSGPANVFEVPVRIFADAVNNRLLIRTTPRTYAMIKALLGRIDTVPAQVLLQVLVVDVSLNDSVKFGVEFMVQGGSGNIETVGGINYNNLAPGSGQKAQSGGTFWIFNPNNPEEKFGYLNALAGKTDIKIISSPQVLITSHNEAKISVGSKVPIINSEITNTQSIVNSSQDSSTNLVRNIQYQDTGVILKVKPHVTRGGRIAIEIAQTVSEADKNNTSDIDSPIIKEQIIETSMTIRDGQTIICGGIIREKKSDNLSTLPIIGSIPFLRRLVGDTDVSLERTEMMILISGYIISENTQLEELLRRYHDAVETLIDFHEPPGVRKRKQQETKGVLGTWFIE